MTPDEALELDREVRDGYPHLDIVEMTIVEEDGCQWGLLLYYDTESGLSYEISSRADWHYLKDTLNST